MGKHVATRRASYHAATVSTEPSTTNHPCSYVEPSPCVTQGNKSKDNSTNVTQPLGHYLPPPPPAEPHNVPPALRSAHCYVLDDGIASTYKGHSQRGWFHALHGFLLDVFQKLK